MRFALLCFGVALGLSSFFHCSTAQLLTFTQYSTGYQGNQPPSVVNFNGQYQMIYSLAGSDTLAEIYADQDVLTAWTQGVMSPQQSTNEPPNVIAQMPTVSAGNYLNLFYRDGSGKGVYYFQGDGTGIWKPVAGVSPGFMTITNQPQAAVAPPTAKANPGRIVVVGDDAVNNRISFAVIDQALVTSSVIERLEIRQSSPVGIVWFEEYFYIFYKGHNSANLMVAWSADGVNWEGGQQTGYDTSGIPVAVVLYKDKAKTIAQYMYVFYKAPLTNDIYYIYTSDGTTYTNAGTLAIGMQVSDIADLSVTSRLDKFGQNSEFVIACKQFGTDVMIFSVATLA